ncbi:MAG: hypothetical protein V3V00_03855 [Saprospiraceae bacterium]
MSLSAFGFSPLNSSELNSSELIYDRITGEFIDDGDTEGLWICGKLCEYYPVL